jgi:hypothetical protein
VSDRELLALERRFRESGSRQDETALLRAMVRVDWVLEGTLRYAARYGHGPSRTILGEAAPELADVRTWRTQPQAFGVRPLGDLRVGLALARDVVEEDGDGALELALRLAEVSTLARTQEAARATLHALRDAVVPLEETRRGEPGGRRLEAVGQVVAYACHVDQTPRPLGDALATLGEELGGDRALAAICRDFIPLFFNAVDGSLVDPLRARVRGYVGRLPEGEGGDWPAGLSRLVVALRADLEQAVQARTRAPVRERVRVLASRAWRLLRLAAEAWRSMEAISEHDDALRAEFLSFCEGRGLDPEDPGSWEAHWEAVDAMIAAFAAARGLDPARGSTLTALEDASEEFDRWCADHSAHPFGEGVFEAWLEGGA